MSKRVLLVGAGHAQVQVLQAAAREPIAGAELALVSPVPRALYSGMLPGFVAGHYALDRCGYALRPLADAARAHFIDSAAVSLDAAAHRVTLADGRVAEYDVLSLDVGSTMDRDAIPGAREHGLFLRPLEAFARLVEGLWELAARRVLDVVVVGGGAAGVETALAIEHRLGGRGEQRARVALVTGGGEPLATHPEPVQRLAVRALARRRITVFRERCARIEAGVVELAGGARLACDAPVLATGPRPPGWLKGSGLQLGEAGHVMTGPTLQSLSHPEVFAVGDVALRSDRPLPPSGVYAVRAGAPLALNLRRFVAGGSLQDWRPPRRTLQLMACGDRRAILSWGGLAAEGRWCGWWKDRIDRAWITRFGGG
jgi:pyridine nucleotide-disulfide oxidoreductase family protein